MLGFRQKDDGKLRLSSVTRPLSVLLQRAELVHGLYSRLRVGIVENCAY